MDCGGQREGLAVSTDRRMPLSASQSRAANSTSVFSTVWRSKVERLMTLSTSAVAVCCSSDSPNRRCAAAAH